MSILAGSVFLLSAAAVLAAMLLPVLLAPRKDFGYAVLYDGLFEAAAEPDGEDLPEDEEVASERVRVVAVEIRNSSGLNIERSHYVRPITVGFGEGARVLDAEVIEEDPPGIEASLRGVPERDPERVALAPVLLNDGDAVLLEAVVANSLQGEIEVDGRMVGIRHLVDRSQRTVEKTVLAVANGIPTLIAVAIISLDVVVAGGLNVVEYFDLAVLRPAAGAILGLVAGDILLGLALYRGWRRKIKVRRHVLARRLTSKDDAV